MELEHPLPAAEHAVSTSNNDFKSTTSNTGATNAMAGCCVLTWCLEADSVEN
jgi:hypothetical protein